MDPTGRKGRRRVWNSRRGNHLGQRSYASAPTGRHKRLHRQTFGILCDCESYPDSEGRQGPSGPEAEQSTDRHVHDGRNGAGDNRELPIGARQQLSDRGRCRRRNGQSGRD